MIYDVIYSLLVLIEKLAFFNKQLQKFITGAYPLGGKGHAPPLPFQFLNQTRSNSFSFKHQDIAFYGF